MPEVLTAPRGELYVARAIANQDDPEGQQRLPLEFVQCSDDGACTARGAGMARSGRQMDVKQNLHWVVKTLPNGSMEIRPVKGWYDLGTPTGPGAMKAAVKPKRLASDAAAEMQRQTHLRKEHSDRWDAMLKRRGTREERKESTEEPEAKIRAKKVMFPAQEGDETGCKKQEEKRRKVLRKQQKAHQQGAEEQAVPEVASSLLELKQGEGGWDFTDEEQFSDDDDQERWDFDDQLVAAAPKEGLPSGDEEDEDTKPEATLSSFGEEIEVLLRGGAEFESPNEPTDREVEANDGGSPEEPSRMQTERLQPAELRELAIKCLKERGQLTSKELMDLLRLQGSQKEIFTVLKEVLIAERKGDSLVVKLKPNI
ncbi:unnamed protein product [Effrenium voratum]|uniref:Uncharacterized protein n=1 Tax=Effrenium voratum TaxID=2562239 RepID=A0AA36NL91_9DINO|nr:unnamed protein product [Effrenium voratum]CAJ1418445.1 unnamed protein product [Effrenium voratum]